MTLVHLDIRAAFRQRLLTALLATTGVQTNLSANGTSFSRTSGSFITDGFAVGDQIQASGFAQAGNNISAIVTEVAAGTLSVNKALVSESAGASATIKAGLPTGRAWEGVAYQPVTGEPFIDESLNPISSEPRALGAKGTIAHVMTGNVSLAYPSGRGTLAIERMAAVLLTLFQPGTILVYGNSNAVATKAERAPLMPDAEWIRCPLIFTFVAYTERQ